MAEIREEVDLPLELGGRRKKISAYLLPDLAVPCVVGMDFLCAFGINLDFASLTWHFFDNPSECYRFDAAEAVSRVCGVLPELTQEQAASLYEFLDRNVPKVAANLGVTALTEHKIDIGQHSPVKQRCYLVSPRVQEAIHEEVDKMLTGIIEPSYSEWSNPIVMVKKPNGKYHFCLDFRKVNSISKKDAYPLPNMNGYFDKLRSARYISTIDLSQAYFQIPLAEDSREITAFRAKAYITLRGCHTG